MGCFSFISALPHLLIHEEMEKDVQRREYKPRRPISIPLTVPWPWGELIPGQCAKLHELQYPPIGWTLASTLTEKRRGPRAVSPRTRQGGASRHNDTHWKMKSWRDQVAYPRAQREQSGSREADANLKHCLCICSTVASFSFFTLKAKWSMVIKRSKKSCLAPAWRSFTLFPLAKMQKPKKKQQNTLQPWIMFDKEDLWLCILLAWSDNQDNR